MKKFFRRLHIRFGFWRVSFVIATAGALTYSILTLCSPILQFYTGVAVDWFLLAGILALVTSLVSGLFWVNFCAKQNEDGATT